MTKISCLNADARFSNLIESNKHINTQNIDIMILQDGPTIRNKDQINKLLTPGMKIDINEQKMYTIYRPTTINIQTKTDININNKATATIIQFNPINDNTEEKSITLINIYIKPRATPIQLEQLLQKIENLTKHNKSNLIIMGDFNATSPLWTTDTHKDTDQAYNSDQHYQNIQNNRGRRIEKFIREMKLWCINSNYHNQPTYQSATGLKSTIDLALIGNKIKRKYLDLKIINTSKTHGHKILTLNIKSTQQAGLHKHITRTIYDTKLINEAHTLSFKIEAQRLTNNWKKLPKQAIINRMNKLAEGLYKCIMETQQTIKKDVRIRQGQGKTDSYTRKIVDKLVKAEDKVKKALRTISINRKHQDTNRHPTHTSAHNRNHTNSNRLREKIFKRNYLKKRVIKLIGRNSINLQKDIWSRIHHFEKIHTNPEQLNQVIPTINNPEQLNQVSNTKFPYKIRQHEITMRSNRSQDNPRLQTLISEQEVTTAIYNLRKKKYTGPEGIKFTVFYKIAELIPKILINICQMSFRTSTIPDLCRTTKGTLIPKRNPGQYRIVHVGTPLSSLLEQIALHRLEYALEAQQLINRRQFGFTALRGRHDLVARTIENIIINGKKGTTRNMNNQGAPTTLVSLDIEGAFDNVKQDMLIDKLLKDLEQKETIQHWLIDFILNRQIIIHCNQMESKALQVCQGVPQGSPLGPILWNYTINDLDRDITTKTGNTVEILAYADDLLIVGNAKHQQNIQATINLITKRLKEMELSVKAEKSSQITVAIATKRPPEQNNGLNIGGTKIPNVEEMSILGISITKQTRLSIEAAKRDLSTNMAKLSNLRQWQCIHTSQEWRALINSFIISIIIDNNVPILAIDKLAQDWADRAITRAMKRIFGWPSNVSNKLTRLISNIPTTRLILKERICNKMGTEHEDYYKPLAIILENGTAALRRGSNMMPTEKTNLELQPTPTTTNTDQQQPHQPQPTQDRATTIQDDEETSLQQHKQQQTSRRYANPALLLPQDDNITRIDSTNQDLIWIAMENGNQNSTAYQLMGQQIINKISTRHETYPLSYFNTLSLIDLMSRDTSIKDRTLGLNRNSSLLAALKNHNQHDYRIIKIRENLIINKWTIKIISNYQETLNKITTNLQSQSNQHQPSPQPTNSSHTNNNQLIPNNQSPYALDYKHKNINRKAIEAEIATHMNLCHTTVTKTLCETTSIWGQLNPSWINSTKMLMLSGLIQDREGNLTNGNITPGRVFLNCGRECRHGRVEMTTPVIRAVTNQIENSTNSTIHQSFNCFQYGHIHTELIKTINDANNLTQENNHITQNLIDNTLRHTRYSQRFIKILSQCALPDFINNKDLNEEL